VNASGRSLAELAHRDDAIIDPNIETSVDQANAGKEQVVFDRPGDRLDPQPQHVVGFHSEHDSQQQERGCRRPGLR
jgi:hypothetical protein